MCLAVVVIAMTLVPAASASEYVDRTAELVSPADKTPNSYVERYLGVTENLWQIAPDGSGIFYTLAFGTPDSTASGSLRYVARRSDDGWNSEQVTPPFVAPGGAMGTIGEWTGRYGYVSPDLRCGFVKSVQPLTADAPSVRERNGSNLFRRDADGSYALATPPAVNAATLDVDPNDPGFGYTVLGGSSDCRSVVFQTNYRFAGANDSGIYRSRDGVIANVGVRPDGTEALRAKVATPVNNAVFGNDRATTRDTSHVYFTAPPTNNVADTLKLALYLHREGQNTVEVSATKTATVAVNPRYQIASRDGEKVAFLANYGLTPTSSTGPAATDCSTASQPCALYVHDAGSGELVDISATTDPANTNGATVAGVLDASDDLTRIYFAAQGQLIPGEGRTYAENIAAGPSSPASTYNIYLYRSGSGLTYVGRASLRDLVATSTGALLGVNQMKASQATPDGRSLLYVSDAVNTGYISGGAREAYLFAEDTGQVVCVSCRPDGQQSVATAELSTPVLFGNTAETPSPLRMISDDGRRVAFSMQDALTPDAQNGRQNIYLWDAGELQLLDSGPAGDYPPTVDQFSANWRDATPYVTGMSPSGDDIFVRTASSLVPQDTDGVKDMYNFRVGGGFPLPPAIPKACDVLADECQGGGFAPASSDTKTTSSSGSENATAETRKTLSLAGLSAKARRKASRTGRLPLSVRASSTGRVSLTVTAKLGKKARRVGRTSKRVKAGTMTRVNLRLNSAARKRLRSGEKLRLTVEVRQSGASTRTRSILLPGVNS